MHNSPYHKVMPPTYAHLLPSSSHFLSGALAGWALSEISPSLPLSGPLLPCLLQVCLSSGLTLDLSSSLNLSPHIRVYTTWEIPSHGHITPGH